MLLPLAVLTATAPPVSVTINEPAQWVGNVLTLLGVIIGALLTFLLPQITQRLKRKQRRRSALLRISGRLRAAYGALHTAFETGMIDRTVFRAMLQRYITTAYDAKLIIELTNGEARWMTGFADVCETAIIHFDSAVYENVPNDPMHRQIIPPTTLEFVILPALSVAASTFQSIGELEYLKKNTSAKVGSEISRVANKAKAAVAQNLAANPPTQDKR